MRQIRSLLFSAVLWLGGAAAVAQAPPPCEPPGADEYLLLVTSPTESVQAQLQQVLPAGATSTVCTYLDDVVLRIGGFRDAENANAWAQYVNDIGGFQTFVARPSSTPPATLPPAASTPTPAPADPAPSLTPAASPTPVATPTPTTPAPAATPAPAVPTPAAQSAPAQSPPAGSIAYRPRSLGSGYAVLVDYFNRPQVAAEVRQLLGRDVGLVSYEQRPYLLAAQTSDAAAAEEILRTLSDRNFVGLIVDSRRAVLLTERVSQP